MIRLMAISFPIIFGMGLSMPVAAVTAQEAARTLEGMTWYTEEYPPYNFEGEDGVPTGMSIDILMAAFERIGVGLGATDIKIVPWNRSYRYVQTRPGTALFAMTYSPEREKIFKFVGPAAVQVVTVIAPKERRIVIRKPSDLNQFKIGVVRDAFGDELVQKLGLRKDVIRRITTADQLVALIESKKVDVVVYSLSVFSNVVKKAGGDPEQYEGIHILKTVRMGYAFHLSTDSAVLEHLQRAIDELKADGTWGRVISSYSK